MTPFKPHLIGSLFNDTTNSYKFYWFLAILNHVKSGGERKIQVTDLAAEMINLVWHPVTILHRAPEFMTKNIRFSVRTQHQ